MFMARINQDDIKRIATKIVKHQMAGISNQENLLRGLPDLAKQIGEPENLVEAFIREAVRRNSEKN